MADAGDSKSPARKGVWVRLPPPVPSGWGTRSCIALLIGIAVAAGCAPLDPGASHPHSLLVDLDGRPFERPVGGDSAATVFLFVRTDCPISNRYAPEIRRIHQRFAGRGVEFWIVYPDPDESPAAIREHLDEFDFPGRPARDPKHDLVRRTGASVTPEAAVFSGGQLAYLGRINDRFVDFGKTRAAATTHDLVQALEAVLGGRSVPEPRTQAIGCFIPELE